jgi:diaminopimelate decarboxylase
VWSSTTRRDASGSLVVGGVSAGDAAAQFGTPVYLIDEADVRSRAAAYRAAFAGWRIYYASKALLSRALVRVIADSGLSLDVCSGNELQLALSADFPAERIGLHGSNKSDVELRLALESGVEHIVADSFDELGRIERIHAATGVRASVLLRIKSGVEAHTHESIATAHEDQKFGFSLASGEALTALLRCHDNPAFDLLGIHSHIGSQIFDTNGFSLAAARLLSLMQQFQRATGVSLPELNLGGGFGIAYNASDSPSTPAQLAAGLDAIIADSCAKFGIDKPKLAIEPGRGIVGQAGTALYTVGTIKDVELDGGARRYVSIDGGMSDNPRPALYGAEYSCLLANRVSAAAPVLSRVVGMHCETGDIVVRDTYLPSDLAVGDLIAVASTGAYCVPLSSNYNMALRPPVVAVRDGVAHTWVRRETYADLLARDVG